jgi:hypothetical protein
MNLEGIRNLFNLGGVSALSKGYHIPTPTEQKTQMIGLKNLSLIARCFVWFIETFTCKNLRPFSQIRYKFDSKDFDSKTEQAGKNAKTNILEQMAYKRIVTQLSNLHEYQKYFYQLNPQKYQVIQQQIQQNQLPRQ